MVRRRIDKVIQFTSELEVNSNNCVHVCPETKANRVHLESRLQCGVPNKTTVDHVEMTVRQRTSRVKRVVGGVPANPVS